MRKQISEYKNEKGLPRRIFEGKIRERRKYGIWRNWKGLGGVKKMDFIKFGTIEKDQWNKRDEGRFLYHQHSHFLFIQHFWPFWCWFDHFQSEETAEEMKCRSWYIWETAWGFRWGRRTLRTAGVGISFKNLKWGVIINELIGG